MQNELAIFLTNLIVCRVSLLEVHRLYKMSQQEVSIRPLYMCICE